MWCRESALERVTYCWYSLPFSFIVEWPKSSNSLLLEDGNHFRLALVVRITGIRKHIKITIPCITSISGMDNRLISIVPEICVNIGNKCFLKGVNSPRKSSGLNRSLSHTCKVSRGCNCFTVLSRLQKCS